MAVVHGKYTPSTHLTLDKPSPSAYNLGSTISRRAYTTISSAKYTPSLYNTYAKARHIHASVALPQLRTSNSNPHTNSGP